MSAVGSVVRPPETTDADCARAAGAVDDIAITAIRSAAIERRIRTSTPSGSCRLYSAGKPISQPAGVGQGGDQTGNATHLFEKAEFRSSTFSPGAAVS